MDIQHKSHDNKGEFFIDRDGQVTAKLTYTKAGDTGIIIDHTEVAYELRGENIGKSLVEHAVQYAREHDLKVTPLCPFTKSVIDDDESLQDVLKK